MVHFVGGTSPHPSQNHSFGRTDVSAARAFLGSSSKGSRLTAQEDGGFANAGMYLFCPCGVHAHTFPA